MNPRYRVNVWINGTRKPFDFYTRYAALLFLNRMILDEGHKARLTLRPKQ